MVPCKLLQSVPLIAQKIRAHAGRGFLAPGGIAISLRLAHLASDNPPDRNNKFQDRGRDISRRRARRFRKGTKSRSNDTACSGGLSKQRRRGARSVPKSTR